MVHKTKWKGMEVFECSKCGLQYPDERIAKDCEEFCSAHNSCSLEITRHAVNI